MNKNVLVTGGAGYIGSSLVRLLLHDQFNVIVLDNLSFGGESLLGIWNNPHFKFIKGDISSEIILKSLFNDHKIDIVIHLAAIVGDPACTKQPELATKVNWDASLKLLERSIDHKAKRFIFASTCSNYGKMANPDEYVDETSPLVPISLYAELKVKFENTILKDLTKTKDFNPTSLRFATVYGISPRMRFDLTVNEFIKELALGRELEVYGEQFWRPYCHVQDIAKAIWLVATSPVEKIAYNVFNVGETTENHQKQMIVEEILKVIPDAVIKYVHKDEDPRNYRVSFQKIKKELGFQPSRTIVDGIREIIDLIKYRLITDPDAQKYRNI